MGTFMHLLINIKELKYPILFERLIKRKIMSIFTFHHCSKIDTKFLKFPLFIPQVAKISLIISTCSFNMTSLFSNLTTSKVLNGPSPKSPGPPKATETHVFSQNLTTADKLHR